MYVCVSTNPPMSRARPVDEYAPNAMAPWKSYQNRYPLVINPRPTVVGTAGSDKWGSAQDVMVVQNSSNSPFVMYI